MQKEIINKIRALPCWPSSEILVDVLEGGITNHNYLVTCADGQFVVRIGDDIPVHQIMRFNEVAAAKAAYFTGLSPKITYHACGVLVMDYIESIALSAERMQQQETLGKVLALIKKCHNELPQHLRGASVVFWVFHVIRDYAATLVDGKSKYVSLLPQLLNTAQELERAGGPFDIVFGHNDLLPANVLDDGSRFWLIDWEYAGFNTPLFDLGGLASNNELSEPLERWLLQEYFETQPDDQLWKRYQAMKCASLLRETLWSMVSEIHSTIDFDYSVYTADNLERFQSSLKNFKNC